MNVIKKIYCRIYQKAFHLAIPLLPYKMPEICESVTQVPDFFERNRVYSVLVVTDKIIAQSEGMKCLKKSLDDKKINFVVYDDTNQNPTIKNVEDALKIYIENNCTGLVGFGGGSAMDCAKAVGARVARPRKSLQKMRGILGVMKKLPPLAAIPTTSGTGSEVTATLVITDDKTHQKYPISDFPLIPNAAVLDAENTRTLPKHLTATTGMDALTHAVEAYIGNSTTRQTRKWALDAVKLVSENLLACYQNGDDLEARKNMLYASFYAGAAFSKSYVGYCHAVAHSLGGKYNIPHGLANAVLLPYTLESYGDKANDKLKDIAIAFGVASENDEPKTAAKSFIAAVREYNKKMDIPSKFSEIKKEDVPDLAQLADKEANPLYPVPKLMNATELEELYYVAMQGEKQ